MLVVQLTAKSRLKTALPAQPPQSDGSSRDVGSVDKGGGPMDVS
jgi:hypothetical protein